jgi:hypothetical protein
VPAALALLRRRQAERDRAAGRGGRRLVELFLSLSLSLSPWPRFVVSNRDVFIIVGAPGIEPHTHTHGSGCA